MTEENVFDFFQTLGFEEIEIEDGLTALAVELNQDGSYALVTNEEGSMPDRLKQFLLFACYRPDGAYRWSVGFKNALVFKEIWSQGETAEQKFEAVRAYWESKGGQ